MDITTWIQALNLENKFLHAVAILVCFFIAAKLVYIICEKVVLKLTGKTKTNIDDLIVNKIDRKISFLLMLIGLKLALVPLEFALALNNVLQNFATTLIIVVMVLMAMNIFHIILMEWGKGFARKTGSKTDDQIVMLTYRFSNAVFFLLAFLFVLQAWGINIGALLASLGIAGLAVAFALQNTLGNIFGGISLILDKSIKVNDRIELDTGESGIVHDVGLRSTKVKTWDNKIIVVPNGKLADSKIVNHIKKDKKTRVVVPFGVAYGTSIEKVRKTVFPELKKVKGCLKDPAPDVQFKLMSDFSLDHDAKFWVEHVDMAFSAQLEATEKIYNALNKARINIPFPTRTVYLEKSK